MQFHAYRGPAGQLLLDLQSDVLDNLTTRIVADLVPVGLMPKPLQIVEPVLRLGDDRYVLRTADMAAVPAHVLGRSPVASFLTDDDAIRRALDMMFSGF